MSSKCYTEEFKIEAVKQVTERGHAARDVASPSACHTTASMTGLKNILYRQPKGKRSTPSKKKSGVCARN